MITIYNMDVRKALKKISDESVNCVITSPPYWALRDYGDGTDSIWGGLMDCEHEFDIKERKLHSGTTSEEWVNDMSRGIRETAGEWKTSDGFCLKCGAWKGQLGLEPTFELYIKHLCDIFDGVKRVLRKDGTCWVNLGDTYIGSPSGNTNQNYDEWGKKGDGLFNRLGKRHTNDFQTEVTPKPRNKYPDPKNPASLRGREQVLKQKLPDKCLTLIPMRFCIEMVNRGWILRNDIVWFKRNSMPSSVKDRVANKWEHVFLFVKNKKYYFNLDAVRKPHKTQENRPFGIVREREFGYNSKRNNNAFNYRVREAVKGTLTAKFSEMYKATPEEIEKYGSPRAREYRFPPIGGKKHVEQGDNPTYSGNQPIPNSLGGNPGDFWDITTQPFPESHFAVFPPGLVKIPIKAGCPEFVCNKCGKPREPIIKPTKDYAKLLEENKINGINQIDFFPRINNKNLPEGRKSGFEKRVTASYEKIGYTNCGCNAGFSPGIVLDPFAGSGTTLQVARNLGRNSIGIEIKDEYIDIIKKRLFKGNLFLFPEEFRIIK